MKQYKGAIKYFLLGCLVCSIILFYAIWLPQILKHERQNEKYKQNTESNVIIRKK